MNGEHNQGDPVYVYISALGEGIACATTEEVRLALLIDAYRELDAFVSLAASMDELDSGDRLTLRDLALNVLDLILGFGDAVPSRRPFVDMLRLAFDLLTEVADLTGIKVPRLAVA